MPHQMYLDLFLIPLVLAAAVSDLAQRRIANRLVLNGFVCALVLHLASGSPAAALLRALAGAATGLSVFLPFYCLRGMAAGDVKLIAMVGAFTGPMLALEISLATFCIGGVMALVLVVSRGRLRDTLGILRTLLRPMLLRMGAVRLATEPLAVNSVGDIPYGVAIALGTMLMLLFRYN